MVAWDAVFIGALLLIGAIWRSCARWFARVLTVRAMIHVI